MKRTPRRLALRTDTVRTLSEVELRAAAAGQRVDSDDCSYTACYKYCSE